MPEERTTAIDFAVLACLAEDGWQVSPLPSLAAGSLDTLVRTLRRQPSDTGSLGFVSVDDDFFVLVRVERETMRFLLSDVTAATEWPLARAVLDQLALPVPDEDEERTQPAGDLGIVADLGMGAMDMGALCDDLDLYPDEMLTEVAERLGFGPAFRRAVETASD